MQRWWIFVSFSAVGLQGIAVEKPKRVGRPAAKNRRADEATTAVAETVATAANAAVAEEPVAAVEETIAAAVAAVEAAQVKSMENVEEVAEKTKRTRAAATKSQLVPFWLVWRSALWLFWAPIRNIIRALSLVGNAWRDF